MGQKVCRDGTRMVCTRRKGELGSGGYSIRILTRLVKLWTGSVGRERRQHNFALVHRILRSQSSSRPGRPSQVGIVVRNPRRIARRLNVCRAYRGVSRNFLFKIADRDVERAASQQIRGGVVVARLGKLAIAGSAREMRKGQGGNKHNKGENN